MTVRYRALALWLALWLCPLWGSAETFLVTSDLHLSKQGEAPALEALKTAPGEALILLGDSTDNAHPGEHARMLDFLQTLERPAWVIPGNHDLAGSFDAEDFAGLYADFGRDAAFSRDESSAGCAVMTPGGTCLLLLDTNALDGYGNAYPSGGVGEATVAWVRRALSALPEDTPVVACGHHPLLPDRLSPSLAGALLEGGVKLYLCGHDHGFAAVKQGGLQQITVGQPQAYPGWAGLLEIDGSGYHWQVHTLYRQDDPVFLEMSARARLLGLNMARGVLKGTACEGDEAAVGWFAEAFERVLTSRLDEESCAALLADPEAEKWRGIETATVVKGWIFSLLEHCPQDVRDIRG